MCVAVHFYSDVPWTVETERFCKYSVIYMYTLLQFIVPVWWQRQHSYWNTRIVLKTKCHTQCITVDVQLLPFNKRTHQYATQLLLLKGWFPWQLWAVPTPPYICVNVHISNLAFFVLILHRSPGPLSLPYHCQKFTCILVPVIVLKRSVPAE